MTPKAVCPVKSFETTPSRLVTGAPITRRRALVPCMAKPSPTGGVLPIYARHLRLRAQVPLRLPRVTHARVCTHTEFSAQLTMAPLSASVGDWALCLKADCVEYIRPALKRRLGLYFEGLDLVCIDLFSGLCFPRDDSSLRMAPPTSCYPALCPETCKKFPKILCLVCYNIMVISKSL